MCVILQFVFISLMLLRSSHADSITSNSCLQCCYSIFISFLDLHNSFIHTISIY